MNAKEIVNAFWQAMQSNDFYKASEWLSEDFECVWPQSSEKIVGRDNFAALNTNYPSHGIWTFEIHSIVCEGEKVVTDVSITDGTQSARAITFHTVVNGLIAKQLEFWPDNYPAPEWRSQWVEAL
ncbi:nuclear transport factor 2 family protein [Vibrio coralliilyticus]|uniref:nuclear transport factor 2 family protein n=1 Tax=Vibrio coralliilyticus TaxID=190893 RepID=UPI00156112D9|nr:nuclear transport factor 2 family protein [Vibrio coralliilyticus]NRF25673.1 nuclear transport factor 2 family protein [Vibrio coralliilyticus]NRF79699.1 nuclear transport factor 2 family protein [Vibrio coralliilyticus]